MMEPIKQESDFPGKRWAMLMALVSGLLFPLASILIITVQERVLFTFKNIFRIHLEHPELFILYLLPLILVYSVHLFYVRQQRKQEYFQHIIKRKDETINRNSQFAEEIGKGNYNVNITPVGDEDVLGKSLLVMKENLSAKDRKESSQNWFSEGRDLISNILRRYNKLEEIGDHLLEHLTKYIDAVQGAIYLYHEEEDSLVSLSAYAYQNKKNPDQKFKVGYGLIGQCAYERNYIYRTEIPEDYFTISSGLLGEKKPASLLIVPLITENMLMGVVEMAFLKSELPEQTIKLVNELGEFIARTVSNLRINQKTEKLLLESQKMTLMLQSSEKTLRENSERMRIQQEELRQSNEPLKSKVLELENSNKKLHWLHENTSEIITIYDRDLNNTYVSPSVLRILGYSQKEYMNGKDLAGLGKDDQKRMSELFGMIIKDPGITPTMQYHYVRKDGQQVLLESKFMNRLEDPSVNGIILNIIDITERIRAE